MPKGQGAEQECGLALGMVAAEARGSIAARQVAGTLPWLGVTDSVEEQRLQADHRGQIGGIGKFPAWWARKAHRCSLQQNGGLADHC